MRVSRTLGILLFLFSAHTFANGEDDLFFDDEIEWDNQELIESDNPNDSFKKTLLNIFIFDVSYTRAFNDEETEVDRFKTRIHAEGSPKPGWYLQLDNKLTYFGSSDRQTNDGNAIRYKLQKASIQYSKNNCSLSIGRQTLLWGAVDGAFAVDIITPFDFTEQLLTDYSAIRLAQDMAISDCYIGPLNLQLFYNKKARLDQISIEENIEEGTHRAELHAEYGGRVIYSGAGYDISLMAARIQPNLPSPVFELNNLLNPELYVEPFIFYGASFTKAMGRLLINFDAGYQADQALVGSISGDTVDRWDLAIGMEYTTTSNHLFAMGIWQNHFDGQVRLVNLTSFSITKENASDYDTLNYSVSWSKSFLNDNLTASILAFGSDSPSRNTITFNSQYAIDDIWSLSTAIGYRDTSESQETPFTNLEQTNQNQFFSFEVRAQF